MTTPTTILGIDIGGTKCALGRLEGDRVEEVARFATTTRAETLARIEDGIASLNPGDEPVFGISCGGPLDAGRGLILSPPNLPGWDEVPICRLLRERFGGTAYLMNDADAGALAEWRFGAGRGAHNVIFCTHGTGFGAGLILDGRLIEGATGGAGEIGHVRLTADGPVGFDKAGSVEGWCSGGGIGRLARQRLEAGAAAFYTDAPETCTARDVVAAARAGDAEAREILAESGRYLGRAMAILVDVLNPELIVLGSMFSRAREFLEPMMRETLQREALAPSVAACRIVPHALGETIGNYAAVAAAMYREGVWR